MGKRIEELKVDDAPIIDPAPAVTDPRGTIWGRFNRDIEDLIDTGTYTWAEDTLRSIQQTVETTQRVTDGQRQAVANIEAGAYKSRGRRWEGFGRRFR